MKQVFKQASFVLTTASILFFSCRMKGNHEANNNNTSSNTTTVEHDTNRKDTSVSTSIHADPNIQFVLTAAKANGREMQLLEAGSQQGSNKKLKADAKKMFEDHKKLEVQLEDYAVRKNFSLSSDTMVDLSAMNGETEVQFDTAWTSLVITGHDAAIIIFQSAQNTVTDPELKTLIGNTLPVLNEHLQMSQSLMASLKK